MSTLGAQARIVFRRASDFVLFCCRAVRSILVEGEELGVFDDGEFIGGERGKLSSASSYWGLVI